MSLQSKLKSYRIFWVKRGTRDPARLGLDETILNDWTIKAAELSARYRGELAGADLDRFEPIVEDITEIPS